VNPGDADAVSDVDGVAGVRSAPADGLGLDAEVAVAVEFPSANAMGDVIFVRVRSVDKACVVTSVSDLRGNAYSLLSDVLENIDEAWQSLSLSSKGGDDYVKAWLYKADTVIGGPNTVTAIASSDIAVDILEHRTRLVLRQSASSPR
jgi:hypothetical protein